MSFNKFLDPKNDFAFKRIFGTEKHKDILMDFINAIIGFPPENQVSHVSFLETIQNPDIAYKKQSLVDVLCQDQEGRQYIIEMQVAKTAGFEKRAQYYASKAYSTQLKEGETYENLKAVIFVAITDFVMFPEKADYYSTHVILDKKSLSRDLKDFSFTFLELPKFKQTLEGLDTIIERWAYFFKHATQTHEKDIERVAGSDAAILHAYEALNRFSWNQKELNTYEKEQKRLRDEQAVLLARLADAKAKGKAEGFAEASLTIAKQLLFLGDLSLEKIAEVTHLSIEELKQIKGDLFR